MESHFEGMWRIHTGCEASGGDKQIYCIQIPFFDCPVRSIWGRFLCVYLWTRWIINFWSQGNHTFILWIIICNSCLNSLRIQPSPVRWLQFQTPKRDVCITSREIPYWWHKRHPKLCKQMSSMWPNPCIIKSQNKYFDALQHPAAVRRLSFSGAVGSCSWVLWILDCDLHRENASHGLFMVKKHELQPVKWPIN